MQRVRRGSARFARTAIAGGFGLAFAVMPCGARAEADAAQVLAGLSIDELSALNVTSVAKRAQPISEAASSVYVITGEAIDRSGASTIPELLRLAPNLEVARIDALDYSITARGFGGYEAANKLLVLIDGRSVYTPLFSGVNWDQHHLLLEDLQRVEVISGPAGALWGANAVNGVVNIATKSAFDTQGMLAAANVGTLDKDIRLRVGGRLGDAAAGRIYFTAFRRGHLDKPDGSAAPDGWRGWQGGFRADWAGDQSALTVQADIQGADIDRSLGASAGYVRGGDLLARWTWRASSGSTLEVQAYYDQIEREARLIHDELKTWDIQFQQGLSIGERHRLVWGGGYRAIHDEFRTLFEPQLLVPPRRRTHISNVFLQDEIAFGSSLVLTLGAKVEDNSYTRAEWLPNARLSWRLSDRQFLWVAVSRAIRNPSRIERDFSIPGVVVPGRMGAERLIAYEAGYRGRIGDAARLSVSLYYNDYDRLRTNDLSPPGGLPLSVGNSMEGRTYGVEAWLDYQIRPGWMFRAGGALLDKHFRLKPGSLDVSRLEAAGVDPEYWIKLHSDLSLTDSLALGLGLRAYGDTPASQAAGYVGAPGYLEAQARLTWKMNDALEWSITGANLLHERHPEASETRRYEVPRSIQVGLRWVR